MISSQAYKFRARITLFRTDMGGRRNPVYNGYKPSFAFNTVNHYSGQIELIGNEELRPGQSSLAHIQLSSENTLLIFPVSFCIWK
jgi:translation elongation factor EF-Tu-like GTPase